MAAFFASAALAERKSLPALSPWKALKGQAVTEGYRRRSELGPRKASEKCKRCGGEVVLAETLPRSLGSPTYEIYRCRACGDIDWVAQDEN